MHWEGDHTRQGTTVEFRRRKLRHQDLGDHLRQLADARLGVENDQAMACVQAALDAGITTFDTADAYANTKAERAG